MQTHLVDRLDDPVDAGIAADGLVLRVDQDDFVVLVGRVLVDPVGVQDTQVGGMATNTLLSSGLKRALVLELVDTLVGGLACIIPAISPRPEKTPIFPIEKEESYRRWHPWEQGACGHRGEHGHGR